MILKACAILSLTICVGDNTSLTFHHHKQRKLEHSLGDESQLHLLHFLRTNMSSKENITIHILFYLHVTW